MNRRPRLAISLGDPCGIGPEILLRSLPILQSWADVLVVGPRAGVELLRELPGNPFDWEWLPPQGQGPEGFRGAACTLKVSHRQNTPAFRTGEALWLDPTPEIPLDHLVLGKASAASGRATVEAIRVAALLTMSGQTDALVTLPMAKSAAHMAGFNIPGHTEYLQELSGSPIIRMAFVSPRLNVVLHTVHQSLRSVVETLDTEGVAETLAFAADRFVQLTGNPDLRIALCALNPHAGEQGAFGDEEQRLSEAILQAEAAFLDFDGTGGGPYANLPSPFPPGQPPEGWSVYPSDLPPHPVSAGHSGIEILSSRSPRTDGRPSPRFYGPLPSDSLFHRASQGAFDLVVALYHDQGLIPIKLLEPARAVNLTLGLPFIRTSPDHGTAFDKAGTWTADAQNFMEAAALAVRLAGRAKQMPWEAQAPPSQA
jgi:4-hydroxythreonine-4-phosphate dehydrogenase